MCSKTKNHQTTSSKTKIEQQNLHKSKTKKIDKLQEKLQEDKTMARNERQVEGKEKREMKDL